MSNARPSKDFLCKLYKIIDYQLFMLSNEDDGSRRDERRHLRNSLRHSRFAVYIHIGGNLVKKMLAILIVLVVIGSGVVPILGQNADRQTISASDIAALSSLGFHAATEADRAEAAAASISFLAVNSVAEVVAILNQTRDAYTPSTTQSLTQASNGSYQRWEICTRPALTWWVNAEVRVTINTQGSDKRYGTVHEKKLTIVGFHAGTWLHNPSQWTQYRDQHRVLDLHNRTYIKVGIVIAGIELVYTYGPVSWKCSFNV